MGLGNSVKSLRVELGLSQRELAEKLAVNKSTIVRWESGESFPKKKVVDRFLAFLKKADISDGCRERLYEDLNVGRRQGKIAQEYGSSAVDQDLLCKIVDESTNAVYAIEVGTYQLLYANKKTEKLINCDSSDFYGKTCYEYMRNGTEPCKDCPLHNITGYEFTEYVIKHFVDDRHLRVRGRRMKWNGKEIYITYVSNVTDLVADTMKKEVKTMPKIKDSKKTILVVDDVNMNRGIIGKIFEKTHHVLAAENGLLAMEIMNKQDVDIVLLDIQMPVMNGYEVIRAMRSTPRLAEIPILVTTGAIDKSERKAFELGADDYLTQPYDPYIMRKRVENLIDRYYLKERDKEKITAMAVENALDQTNEMVLIADWETREILYLNQAAAHVSGRTTQELLGCQCSQIAQHCDEPCSYCFKNELNYDELLVREMAVHNRYFQTKGKRMIWNGREAFVEYVSDVTAQHNMTKKVVFERNLVTLATRVLFPMCIISNLTKNTYNIVEYENFNTKKAATDGSYDELIAVGASTIPEDHREQFVQAFGRENLLLAHAQGKTMVPLTHKQIGDDGIVHWNRTVLVFADQLFDGDLFSISFTENVDEQKQNEENLNEAMQSAKQANVAKTAFLSRVSHDMRTPLNGILGLTTILKDSIVDEKVSKELKDLEISGKYLLSLINDTLDVSRIENGKMELNASVCDGKDLLNNTLNLVKTAAKAKNIKLNVQSGNIALEMVYADVGRIEQIFMNVVSNAIKFTPVNGKVDITLTNLGREGNVLIDQLVVRDYGIGMSEEFLPHIFEPFSQEDNSRTSTTEGTGLGMAITKQLVELMGGEISVESKLGKGTTFTIVIKLPIATKEQILAWKKSQETVDVAAGLAGKRVLLCEDHPLNTQIATKLLEVKGILVEHAANGEIGVDMFTASQPGYYDAILMDIRMPVMDGMDATKAIRNLEREDAGQIPILAMTANAFAEDVAQTKAAGMNAHLSKPIQTKLLYKTLSELIGD